MLMTLTSKRSQKQKNISQVIHLLRAQEQVKLIYGPRIMISLGRTDRDLSRHEGGFSDTLMLSNVLSLYLGGDYTGVFTFIKLNIDYLCTFPMYFTVQ